MKNFKNILFFCVVILISTASQAYVGVKLGGFSSGGDTSWGGGLVWGIPMPVKGLAIEIEESGYYNSGTIVDQFFLQTSAGPVYDFNLLITPDSNFFSSLCSRGARLCISFLQQ
jgi:hypothetical protein